MTSFKYEELYETCVKLFGKKNVERDNFEEPNAVEMTVHIPKITDNVETINLNLYGNDFYMHIGTDFHFEFDDKEDLAISEMKKYLKAAAQGKLSIQTKKIFGITISKRLVIVGG